VRHPAVVVSAARAAEFVRGNPGCTVSQVADQLGVDNAAAWLALIAARNAGTVTFDKPEGQPWRFNPREA
jgi:hypothetical protein